MTTTGVEYRQKKVENASFYVNKQIDELIAETEVSFFGLISIRITVSTDISSKN